MANEITLRWHNTGDTLYAQVVNAAGEIYNGVGFETPADANWDDYDIPLAEAGTTQVYRGSFPAVAAGAYTLLVYEQTGGVPAVADVLIGTGEMQWDGTGETPLSALSTLDAATVNAEVDTALADYDAPTHAELVAETNAVRGDIAALHDFDPATETVNLSPATEAQIDAIEADTNELQTDNVPGLIAALHDFDPTGEMVTVGALDTAALAQFATIDTGEVAAVAGSVAQLAQGGGSGAGAALPYQYTGEWNTGQQNLAVFRFLDATGVPVTGLGNVFAVTLSKGGGPFVASAGIKAEIADGWYSYLSTAGEADTPGPVALQVAAAGVVPLHLEYVVDDRTVSAIEYTYTITNLNTGLPIEGVAVWFTTDIAGDNPVWHGATDMFGVARNALGGLPRLDPGTYYIWRKKAGYAFNDPDTEIVSL